MISSGQIYELAYDNPGFDVWCMPALIELSKFLFVHTYMILVVAPKMTGFWAHLCILHDGLICITFCLPVCPYGLWTMDWNIKFSLYFPILVYQHLRLCWPAVDGKVHTPKDNHHLKCFIAQIWRSSNIPEISLIYFCNMILLVSVFIIFAIYIWQVLSSD